MISIYSSSSTLLHGRHVFQRRKGAICYRSQHHWDRGLLRESILSSLAFTSSRREQYHFGDSGYEEENLQ